ncbi:tetratricopeptide repeat protein [Streptomyces sp. MB09-01]|uniref:tetratricopeptide repeat protein n=1 Tax=Streptomyces sp. MB09-01 TaxID=3028666 RepID=UPI0029BC35FB|nr:tetratricopeptide repeat protein [Streptomyces sp. MB09-01]MDX3538484.1 tetratricopeptide repeat protein [Streptomyces sp. MB09-01]
MSWPHQVGVIPRRADCFQLRHAADQVGAALADGDTAVLVGQVLAGAGGVGKTQLAADHARRAWHSGAAELLIWITASTRTAIMSGYAQAAAEVLPVPPENPEDAARAFLAWLEPRATATPRRWLIVLDDVSAPADLSGLWPPDSPHGATVVTTRRRDAALSGPGRRQVPVGMFTPDEATSYLRAALAERDRHEPDQHLAHLAADLGHLPLALSQAAAYLIDAELDCATYRRRLADHTRRLADLLPDTDALPDDQTTSTAAAWSLSIDRADRLRPAGLARPMLEVAAMLDPNGIPAPVLTSPPVLAFLAEHRTHSTPGNDPAAPITAEQAYDTLRVLHRLSLIDHTPGTPQQAVHVHQLIQRAVREPLPTDRHDRLARTAADALTATWPDVERDTALARALRANTAALTRHAPEALYQPEAHTVLYRTGASLGEAGQVTAATAYFRHLADTAHTRLGPDHTNTLAARYNLAYWRRRAGNADGAADFEQLLEDTLRVLGPDHPNTLAARSNLAHWQGQAGDAAAAAASLAELLEDRLQVLGPDHPYTLTARHNLAYWRGRAGDMDGAADFEQLLADMLRVLGPDHPDTLSVRSSLARWRGEAGDADGAAADFENLLPDRLRVSGADHPDTLTTRHDLAHWRGRAGDADGAAADFEQLLPDMLRVLGPDHPDTLTTRHDLAYWRGRAGDAHGAAADFEQLLPDRLRVLGPDHPDTLTTRHSLGRWRGEAGEADGVAASLAELLPDRVRVLGPDHPDTLTTRHDLAYWRGRAGDAHGAAADFEQLLPDRLRVLGPDHPDTLTTRHDLAHWQGRAGDPAGAAAALAELLADRMRVLGPDHPHTLTTRHNLAHWRGETGGAEAVFGNDLPVA